MHVFSIPTKFLLQDYFITIFLLFGNNNCAIFYYLDCVSFLVFTLLQNKIILNYLLQALFFVFLSFSSFSFLLKIELKSEIK